MNDMAVVIDMAGEASHVGMILAFFWVLGLCDKWK